MTITSDYRRESLIDSIAELKITMTQMQQEGAQPEAIAMARDMLMMMLAQLLKIDRVRS